MVSSSPIKVAHLASMLPQEKGIDNGPVLDSPHLHLGDPAAAFRGGSADHALAPTLVGDEHKSAEEPDDDTSTGDSEGAMLSSPPNDSPQSVRYPNSDKVAENVASTSTSYASALTVNATSISTIRALQTPPEAPIAAELPSTPTEALPPTAVASPADINGSVTPAPPPHPGKQPEVTNEVPMAITTPSTDHPTIKSKPRTQTTQKLKQRPSTATSKRAVAVAAAELDNEVLVGTRVSEGHGNFVTAYNMLTGIRVAVSRCTAKNNRLLTPADFTSHDEISFDMSGGGHSPSSKYMFHFKDYSPWVFRHLRELFKLDPADYLMSLTAKYIVSELGSPGKSGSFFYYSRDYRFIIKTIRHSEHKLLRRILRQYYEHVRNNPDTLISQFYGLHRVRLPFGRKIHFVVMNNVFPALYEIHERYDLKGSLLGREYHPDSSKPIVVYKDLDWLRNHRRIVLGPVKRERIINQLEKDIAFLKAVNVMDYSLLIGIHDMTKGNAALTKLFNLDQFGPVDTNGGNPETSTQSARVLKDKVRSDLSTNHHGDKNMTNTQREFTELQTLLLKATPEKLREFDFADEYRSEFYFYRDHGGFQSTDDNNQSLDVIYYVGVIDFLTGYTFRKSVETFCKSLVYDRKELSAVPANEYGDRFLKFLRGSIGPAIPSTVPHKRSEVEAAAKRHEERERVEHEHMERDHLKLQQLEQKRKEEIEEEQRQHHLHEALDFSDAGSTPSLPRPRSSGYAPPITAVTVDNQKFETIVRAHSPIMEQSRRPSVVGYGQDIPKVV